MLGKVYSLVPMPGYVFEVVPKALENVGKRLEVVPKELGTTSVSIAN